MKNKRAIKSISFRQFPVLFEKMDKKNADREKGLSAVKVNIKP